MRTSAGPAKRIAAGTRPTEVRPLVAHASISIPDFKALLQDIDHVLLDCDGVIWLENHLIGNAKATIEMFRKHGLGAAFVSNNATSTRRAYADKFKSLGIDVPMVRVSTHPPWHC